MIYSEEQARVLDRLGINETPSTLLDRWEMLVGECESGYSWDYSEYRNELRVRDLLEGVLRAPELLKYEEHDELMRRVEELDGRFRCLLSSSQSGVSNEPWWRRGVLCKAGPDYAEYCRSAFSIEIEVVK